jgi:hypothetical protein
MMVLVFASALMRATAISPQERVCRYQRLFVAYAAQFQLT